MSRRSRNRDKLADWLDGVLPTLHPGSPDPDMLPDDNAKGPRILLYETMIRRIDGEGKSGEEESHQLLMYLMVASYGPLARQYPLYHHDLTTNVFTAPAGHERLLEMEASKKTDTRERAANCRAGIERVLDMLEERGAELAVPVVPGADSKKAAVVERDHARIRDAFEANRHTLGSDARALDATAVALECSRRRVELVTEDLRGERRHHEDLRQTFLAKLARHGDTSKAIRQTSEQTGYSASQVRRATRDLRRSRGEAPPSEEAV